MIIRHRRVRKAVEFREPADIVEYAPAVRVEDVRAVAVHLDPLDLLRVDVARDMIPSFNDKDTFPRIFRLPGEYRAEQPGAGHQIIVLHTNLP